VSLIGTLELINLANVLQRVEAYTKTGLCVIRQGVQWVELYFGEGRLICINTNRADTLLGDRLVEADVISPQALQATLRFMEVEEPSEMRLALTLMDLGYADRAALRAWVEQQAVDVLQLLFTWSTGEIYFEEHVVPPADRLLVALSITSLLSAATDISVSSTAAARPISGPVRSIQKQQKRGNFARVPDTLTMVDVAEFFTEITPALPVAPFAQQVLSSDVELADTVSLAVLVPFQQAASSLPQGQVMASVMPRLIDTSFMRPEMVLVPADLSAFCEQNPQIALTPEQWQLLARADSQTSLQMVCQLLGWRPETVCRVAGELLVEGLLHVVPPTPEYVQELSLTAQTFMSPSLSTTFSGSLTNSAPLWSASEPEVLPQYVSVLSDEPQPQRGNQALQLSKLTSTYGDAYAYAGAGGNH
jgi:Domain of unknown function (DUF4388)